MKILLSFPSRIFLHLALAALLTIKIIDWNVLNASYGRSLNRTFSFLFGTQAMIQSPNNNQIYTFDEFEAALETVFTTYQTIQSISVSSFSYGYRDQQNNVNCKEEPQTITSTTYYWSDSTHIHSYEKEIIRLSDLKIIASNSSLFYQYLDSFHLSFDLCNYQSTQYASYLTSSVCNYWEIHLHYKFIGQLYIEVDIDTNMQKSCSTMSMKETFQDFISSIEVVTCLFCVFYAILLFRDINIAIKLYFQVKEAHRRARVKYLRDPCLCNETEAIAAQYDWKEIPTGIKRSFHSYWSIFSLLGAILTFIDSLYTLSVGDYRYVNYYAVSKALLGLSCLLVWSTAIQFIYYFPALYAMAVTIQTALPRILAFLLGFVPIYFAFVFLGIGLFGYKLGMFSSLSLAASSMFAFVNGDSIRPILLLMKNRSYIAAILYGIIFILLTTYLLLNILIAIVEEAYFLSRKKSRFLEYLMWKNLQSIICSSGGNASEANMQDDMKKEAISPIEDEEGESSDEEDEWIQNVYSSIYSRSTPKVSPDDLNITLAEEAAEMYILGKTHWEYSKMMDYLVKQLSTTKES